MPSRKKLSERVLKAVSSSIRLGILRLLLDRGSLSYTEIMNNLKMSPSKDAGRFAYHLKVLLNMDLIEPDPETKKYKLTDLGKSVIDFVMRLEESTSKKRMLVRTSRLAIEYFDRNKIVDSLVREANVPLDLAQKIARETEERISKLDTKYLTAPLIREFVNAILIERGLEEYRHKLTRLGLPVYDVTQLIKSMGAASLNVEAIIAAAGKRVIEEYVLLNILPRDVADSHLSGSLNLDDLGYWILKLSSFMHDARFFFKNGLIFKEQTSDYAIIHPPESFNGALNLILNVLKISSTEISQEQGIDFFNIFLAPFIKGLPREEVKNTLKNFIISTNLTVSTGVSFGISLEIPEFLVHSGSIVPGGKTVGTYEDFIEESRTLALLMLETFNEICVTRPIFNPSLIIRVERTALNSGELEDILYEAHKLAVNGLPYFANIFSEEVERSSHLASGHMFVDDWRRDWELDIIRVGCAGSVTINLPRALYEAKGNRKAFLENLYDFMEKALRALEIKYLTIKHRVNEGLLPLLSYGGRRDPYCRFDNLLFLVSFVGLNEVAQSVMNSAIYEGSEPLTFIEDVLSYSLKIIGEHSIVKEMRCALSHTPSIETSRRMATLDIERYGLSGVRISGSRDKPYYSDLNIALNSTEIPIEKRLSIHEKIYQHLSRSSLVKIPIGDSSPDELLSIAKKIVGKYKIPLYTFDTTLTYCSNCRRTFRGTQPKCPSCGSTSSLSRFIRGETRYTLATY
ncbi:MAG: anaerobic ribonucleoside-triphosphate reductase [Candidatus Bathyarchaeia archaeon]|nr:helix-turn-helix domain-containing protein [Candidatus Bathyarchaeota archaeon]